MFALALFVLGAPGFAGCGGGSNAPVQPTPPNSKVTWTMWGDSLTQLGYPSVVAELTGDGVVNEGVISQTSTEIAVREGGVPVTVTVSGNQIPTSGGVQVTFPEDQSPAAFVTSGDLVLGSIAGVEGVTLDNGSHVYTFTPAPQPATPVKVDPGTLWKPDLTGLNTGPVVIWAGRNNFNHPEQVLSDVKAMVATLPSPRNYVVLGVINADYPGIEYKGDPAYNIIVALNQSLAAAFPGHYYDIRAGLVGKYNPDDPQDVIDHGHDVPPSSLKGINPYCAGTLTAPITSVAQTQISISNYDLCRTLTLGSEKMEILSFSAGLRQPGIATVIRGYASTTPATYPQGTPYTAIDPLHTVNTAGNTAIAEAVIAAQASQPSQ